MTIEKTPFIRYNADEDDFQEKKAKTDVMTMRLNKEEQAMVKDLKRMFSIGMDSTALKIAAKVGYRVLLGFFGADLLAYLSDPSRVRDNLEVDNRGRFR